MCYARNRRISLRLTRMTITAPSITSPAVSASGHSRRWWILALSAIAGAGGGVGLLLGGVLTEYLSWGWTMLINVGFALVAVSGALALIRDTRPTVKPRLDIPGTLAASSGLFMLAYGFSQASTHGWGATITDLFLAAGIALLGVFLFLTYYVQETLGYTTAFTWSAVIFAVGGLCCGLLLRSGRGQESELAAEPPAEPAVADQPALPQTSAQAA